MFNRVICNSYGHAWVAIGYARKTDDWIIWNHSVHSPFLFSCVSAGSPTMRTTVTTVAMDADVSGMFCTLGVVPHTMTLGISPAYISCSVFSLIPRPSVRYTHARAEGLVIGASVSKPHSELNWDYYLSYTTLSVTQQCAAKPSDKGMCIHMYKRYCFIRIVILKCWLTMCLCWSSSFLIRMFLMLI